jgi:glycosyltransferase involved in cell wall biosynthesis
MSSEFLAERSSRDLAVTPHNPALPDSGAKRPTDLAGAADTLPRQGSPAGATPLVSVVIPCFNYARFLGQTIQSVLDQAYPALEIFVVDDGSSDDPAAVVAQFPSVRFIRQENRGLSAARNTGLAHCRGELVVFLDADDRLLPGAIATGARLLTADPSLGFAAGFSMLISGDGLPQPTVNGPGCEGNDPYVALLRRNTIRNPATVVFRRGIVEAVGGFAAGVDACADYDMYLRISRSHPVAFHDEVVAEYRKHGHNMSDNAAQMLREALVVLRRQRSHLVTSARREACRDGIRNIRSYYGDALVTQIRARIRTRSEWKRLMQDLAVLVWWHPAGAVEHARRKIALSWKRPAATGPATSPQASAQGARGALDRGSRE